MVPFKYSELRDFSKTLDPQAQARLAQDASECATDEDIRQLFMRINGGLLVPIKRAGGKTPTDLTHSFTHRGVELNGTVPGTRSTHKTLRNHFMQRDGFRYVASSFWHINHESLPEGAETGDLETAHIIPFNLGFHPDNSKNVKRHGDTSIWANLNCYFPSLEDIPFSSEQINIETNAMMLDRTLHHQFGAFKLCFIATDINHQYHLETFKDTPTSALRFLPTYHLATLQSHEGKWELPDPELLRIHAQLADIFHKSGHGKRIGKRIDKIWEDYEDLRGLASDGSTNVEDLLACRMSSIFGSFEVSSGSESK